MIVVEPIQVIDHMNRKRQGIKLALEQRKKRTKMGGERYPGDKLACKIQESLLFYQHPIRFELQLEHYTLSDQLC